MTLTVEPADGSVFGLPPTVPVGTNLVLFNAADRTFEMLVLEKNASQTESWDALLACGLTSDVATVVATVSADVGQQSTEPITVQHEGDDLLVLIPTGPAPSESVAPPTEAASALPSEAASALPSEAASALPTEAASPSAAPVESPPPAATPSTSCAPTPPAGSPGPSSSIPAGTFPDLTNAATQEFLVTPAGTLPGQTPAPQASARHH